MVLGSGPPCAAQSSAATGWSQQAAHVFGSGVGCGVGLGIGRSDGDSVGVGRALGVGVGRGVSWGIMILKAGRGVSAVGASV